MRSLIWVNIELALGNDRVAQRHFAAYLRINPDFKKAPEKLKLSHPLDEIRLTGFLEKTDDGQKNSLVS